MILAFDLATQTGYCYGAHDECPSLGHFRLPKTGEDVGAFLDAGERSLDDLMQVVKPTIVCFEAPILPPTTAIRTVRKLHGLAGMLELVCHRRKVECVEVSVTAVKKVLTGSGAAKKEQMVEAARAMGFDPRVEDEADALGVWIAVVRARFPQSAGRLDPMNFGGHRP